MEFTKEEIFEIYKSNPYYFIKVYDREAKLEDVEDDIHLLPATVDISQKHYKIISEKHIPLAVIDYLEDYPEKGTVYIGLFLLRGEFHKRGMGKAIFQNLEKELQEKGFLKLRIAVIQGNDIALLFWKKMCFNEKERKTWTEESGKRKEAIIMEKKLK